MNINILEKLAKEKVDREYIEDVRKNLISNNRFFTDDRFMLILKTLFLDSLKKFPKGSIFYRARKYSLPDAALRKMGYFEKNKYEGYDQNGSFVKETDDFPSFGRMDPRGIRVLYISSDIETCIKEMNPSVDELISVAEIECQDDLLIADISSTDTANAKPEFINYFLYIQEFLSTGYQEKDYIFPQFIAAYCQKLGFDGIGYRSKFSRKGGDRQNTGINYTVFNYKKCSAISSKLHIIKDTTISYESVDAKIPEGTLEALNIESLLPESQNTCD